MHLRKKVIKCLKKSLENKWTYNGKKLGTCKIHKINGRGKNHVRKETGLYGNQKTVDTIEKFILSNMKDI